MSEDVVIEISETTVAVGVTEQPVTLVKIIAAGPVGPAGPGGGEQGPPGPQGIQGEPGEDGQIIVTEGNVVTGEGDPDNGDGEPDGTLYIDTVAPNNLWLKESGVYNYKVSIKGAQGAQGIQGVPGTAGADGKNVHSTNGVPSNALGVNGEIAIDYVNGDLYDKAAGVWVLRRSIIGPQGEDGEAGPAGADGPPGADGAQGEDGEPGADGGSGFTFTYTADTSPANGFFNFVGGVLALGELDENGAPMSGIVAENVIGTRYFFGKVGEAQMLESDADGSSNPGGEYYTLSATMHTSSNFFVEGETYRMMVIPVGAQGPAGEDGEDGAPGATGANGSDGAPGAAGADGLSAYEVAVEEGFIGDETAWLASLVGPAGADGDDGAPGAPGADGTDAAIERDVPSTVTASANLDDDDGGTLISVNPASADVVFTVRKQVTYAWSENWQIDFVNISDGTYEVRIVAEDGDVTILTGEASGDFRAINPHGGTATLNRLAANVWVLSGNTAEVA